MKPLAPTILALALTSLAFVPPVHAQYLGLEGDFGVPGEELLDLGWGVQARLGAPVPVDALRLDGELAFDYSRFGGDSVITHSSIWRLVAGLRVGLDAPLIPYLVGHVGYGRANSELTERAESEGGLAWDVGLASDLVVMPPVTLGAHISYKVWNTFADDANELELDPVRWVGIGLHGHFGTGGATAP